MRSSGAHLLASYSVPILAGSFKEIRTALFATNYIRPFIQQAKAVCVSFLRPRHLPLHIYIIVPRLVAPSPLFLNDTLTEFGHLFWWWSIYNVRQIKKIGGSFAFCMFQPPFKKGYGDCHTPIADVTRTGILMYPRCASTDSLTFDFRVHQLFMRHIRLTIKVFSHSNKYHIVSAVLLWCQISSRSSKAYSTFNLTTPNQPALLLHWRIRLCPTKVLCQRVGTHFVKEYE